MAEEWSGWVEHDGKGCRWMGRMVRVETARGGRCVMVPQRMDTEPGKSLCESYLADWTWKGARPEGSEVVRYCLPRTPAVRMLLEIADGQREPARRD